MAFFLETDFIETERENAVLEHELETLLDMLFDGIMTDSYISPQGIFAYLKATYPNRFRKKMEQLYAQRNESDRDS